MNKKTARIKGFTLIEILVVIAIFATVVVAVAFFAADSFKSSQGTGQRISGSTKLQEISNSIILYKRDHWESIVTNTDDGQKSLTLVNNKYVLNDGTSADGNFTHWFTIDTVERDVDGNIVESGGTIDPQTREINITLEWFDVYGSTKQLTSKLYANSWAQQRITETTAADFDNGTFSDTYTSENGDGEVSIERVFFPDWCNPALSLNPYDIPGGATATTVFAKFDGTANEGKAYLGTGGNATGDSLTEISVVGIDPPIISVDGTYDSYLVNDIFIDGNYAYLATTDDAKEVVILNISSFPYTEVGYFNAAGNDNGESVYVVGNVGYLAAYRYVYTFNLTSKTGSRPQYDNVNVSTWLFPGTASQIIVNGSHVFTSMYNDWYELVLVNITNPSNISVTSRTSTNNQQTLDIEVSSDGNRAYFGTGASSSENEFFIVNTTNKTSNNLPVIGSFDTAGMTVKAIAIIEEHDRAVLVGQNGEEYQAVNISNESNLTKCGGMQFANTINDIDTLFDNDGNVFSYLMTSISNADFQVLRGGPGGGDENGYGYYLSGQYESSVIDSGYANVNYFSVDWTKATPFDTSIQIQIRAGTSSNLTSQPWMGPDGTNSTYFTNSFGEALPSTLDGNRYFQYKVFLTTNDISVSPVLESINIYLEEAETVSPTPSPSPTP